MSFKTAVVKVEERTMPSEGQKDWRFREVVEEMHRLDRALGEAARAIAEHWANYKDLRMGIIDGHLVVRVGAMGVDPDLHKLEAHRNTHLQRGSEILAEYAKLKKE
jgi:hypothetical protein